MSCEVLAVSRLHFCGTRTKYTNISSVIACQVEQAIETGAVRVGERKGAVGHPGLRETPGLNESFGFQRRN